MSNPLPSALQYGAHTVVKAVDERKNVQSAAIRLVMQCRNCNRPALQHAKRRVSRRRPEERDIRRAIYRGCNPSEVVDKWMK